MKTTKKITALLLCLILAVVQAACFAETGSVIRSTISITLHHNIMLSCYGVTVYFDGVKVGHLDQGDMLTFDAYMADNQVHELRFVADDPDVPDRVWTLSNLQHGSALTCEIQAKHNQIKVRSYNLSVNGESVCGVSADMEAKVRLFGTIITTGAKIYQATH